LIRHGEEIRGPCPCDPAKTRCPMRKKWTGKGTSHFLQIHSGVLILAVKATAATWCAPERAALTAPVSGDCVSAGCTPKRYWRIMFESGRSVVRTVANILILQ
jgi:hypothetical protein